MNEESALKTALENAFGSNTPIRCALVAGGLWIIEVVLHNLDAKNRQASLDKISQSVFSVGNNVIWKVFIYKSENERYTENGTLHTQYRTYSSDGYPTTTLAANDTYLNISEFDAEVLMIEPRKQHKVYGIEAISTVTYKPILPFNSGVDYLWLEAQGGSYYIAQNGVAKKHNDVVEITLGSRP